MKIFKILGIIAIVLIIFFILIQKSPKNNEVANQEETVEVFSYQANVYFIKDYLEIISNLKTETGKISSEVSSTSDLFSQLGKIALVNKLKLRVWEKDENEIIRKTVSHLNQALDKYTEISNTKPNTTGFESMINSTHQHLIDSAEEIVQLKLTRGDNIELLKNLNENILFDFEDINTNIENGQPVKGWDVGFFLLMIKVTDEM